VAVAARQGGAGERDVAVEVVEGGDVVDAALQGLEPKATKWRASLLKPRESPS
jgi:hypothetical protein